MILGHLRQNLVAYVALAVALGTGTAYAAEKIPNGSVTTKKLATNAVTSTKIKNGAVKAIDINGGAVTSFTVADGSLTANDLATGAVASTEIVDDTITSADVKDNTLTHRDINDSVVPQDADVFNSSAVPGGPAPAVAAQTGQNPFTFTTTRNGKLDIEFFAGELGVDCGAGNQGQVALFIDGAFQPGTLTNVPAPGQAGAVQIVSNQTLPAGSHTLTTTEYCVAGTHVPSTDQRVTWNVEILAR